MTILISSVAVTTHSASEHLLLYIKLLLSPVILQGFLVIQVTSRHSHWSGIWGLLRHHCEIVHTRNMYSAHTMACVFCSKCIIPKIEGKGVKTSQCPICNQPGWKRDLKPVHVLANIAEPICHLLASGRASISPQDAAWYCSLSQSSKAVQPDLHAPNSLCMP